MSIEKLALEVIRALAQTAEAIAGTLAGGDSALNGASAYRMLVTAQKLSDRIEHVAQYSLNGDSDSFQRQCLHDDIEFLSAVLAENQGTLCASRPWALPSDEFLLGLLTEANSVADSTNADA